MAGRRIICTAWVLAGTLMVAAADAAPFTPPAVGPVPFRLDRLPIEVGLMRILSGDLVMLCKGQEMANPEDRRTAAQLLALAAALDPDNAEVTKVLGAAKKGSKWEKPTRKALDRSKERIWSVLEWLVKPDAGADGNSLGACLGDLVAKADPSHPGAAKLLDGGEKGGWKLWIPELESYKEVQLTGKEKNTETMEPPSPDKEAPAGEPAKILLENSTISTPLWAVNPDTGAEYMGSVPVEMKIGIQPPVEGSVIAAMTFSITNTMGAGQINRMNRVVHGLLVKRYGILPVSSQATFTLGSGETPYLIPRNRDSLSGAAAVLLDAALSGKAPTGTVIGRLEADGSLKAMPDLWDRLRALSGGSGGRLIIPAEAEDLLKWLIALEDTEFFLKYDVLVASNFDELTERSQGAPAASMAEVLGKFNEVREKSKGIPVGLYLSNRFVRQRLTEIVSAAPYHASAKLLVSQTVGERQVGLPKKILALELRRSIQPLAWVRGKSVGEIDTAQLDTSYDQVRALVDQLEKHSANPELLQQVREMVSTVRAYSRAVRINEGRDKGPAIIAEAFDAMRTSHLAVIAELDTAIGEAAPEEPEPVEAGQ